MQSPLQMESFDLSLLGIKQAGASLLLQSILATTKDYSLIATNLDGLIMLWNEGAKKIYGYDATEAIGKLRLANLYETQETGDSFTNEVISEVLKNGRWEKISTRIRKNGDKFRCYVLATLLSDSSGNPTGILSYSRDLTSEDEIKNYTRSLIESNIDALVLTDLLGVITDVNKEMENITGYSRNELINTSFKDYITDTQRAEEVLRNVLTNGKIKNYELTIKAKSGKQTTVSFNATTFIDSNQKTQGVFAAARDITEFKKLEKKLVDSQSYNRGLIESSIDGLITVNAAGIITDVNKQLCVMSGYSREELIESLFKDYFEDAALAESGINKTFAEKSVTNYKLRLVKKNGQKIDVSLNASVYKDSNNEIEGIFASARDISDQEKLEFQLTSEKKYNRSLIDASIDLLLVIDLSMTITDVNETMCRVTGYKKEELCGQDFLNYFTDPKKITKNVTLTYSAGFVKNIEVVLKKKDKKELTVTFNASVFKDAVGNVAGCFVILHDVSEETKLKNLIIDKEVYNRSLIESSADALFAISSDGRITDVNEEAIKMTGYQKTHLIGSYFQSYFTEPDKALNGIKETASKKRVLNYQLILVTHDKQNIDVSFNASLYFDSFGKPVGIIAAARDIRENIQLEKQLRNAEFYARSLIESNTDALCTIDPLGIIMDVNKQMQTLTGYSINELIGSKFQNYFTDPVRAEEGVKLVLKNGQVKNYELTAKSKLGHEIIVSYNAVTFFDQLGKLQGVFASARDITEIKLGEVKLKESINNLVVANRELQIYAHVTAHELQEPLRMISSYTQLLEKKYKNKLTAEADEYIQFAVSGAKRLQSLLNDLLLYNTVANSKGRAEEVDVNQIIKNIMTDFKDEIQKKNAEITHDEFPMVVTDKIRLSIVFGNLISNAIKFCDKKPIIHIGLNVRPNQWEFTIKDNGIGIDPQYFEKIFVMFQQLNEKNKYSGNGLGLAMVKRIIEQLGGTIWVESKINQGTTFHFTFPRPVSMDD